MRRAKQKHSARRQYKTLLLVVLISAFFIISPATQVQAEENVKTTCSADALPEETIQRTGGVSKIWDQGGNKRAIAMNERYICWSQDNKTHALDLARSEPDGKPVYIEIDVDMVFSLKISGNRLLIDHRIVDLETGNWSKAAFFPERPMGNFAIFGDTIAVSLDMSITTDKTNYDVFVYDIPYFSTKSVVTDPEYQSQPALWGDSLIWIDGRYGAREIQYYDLINETSRRLTTSQSLKKHPWIQGDVAVWTDYINVGDGGTQSNPNIDIYMYDLRTNTTSQVTTDQFYQNHARVYGDKIVYEDLRNNNSDIYLYDISTGNETRITEDPGSQIWPQIWGEKVIWLDGRKAENLTARDYQIYQCDLALDDDLDGTPNYLDSDDDNDGYTDGQEICNATDPFDPDDYPIETIEPDNGNLIILVMILAVLLIFFISAYILVARVLSARTTSSRDPRQRKYERFEGPKQENGRRPSKQKSAGRRPKNRR